MACATSSTVSPRRARELSFEEARAWLDGTEACDAFRDWNAAVAASVMVYSPPLSKRR